MTKEWTREAKKIEKHESVRRSSRLVDLLFRSEGF